MSSEILVSPPRRSASHRSPPAATSTRWTRLLRAAVFQRLSGLRQGAVRVRDELGEVIAGDAHGPLGVVDLEVRDAAFYRMVAGAGSVGAGESYVAGHWFAKDLVGLLRLLVRNHDVLLGVDRSLWSLPQRLLLRLGHWLRDNNRRGSQRNIADHYDLGDELFEQFLDPSMTYSSAWFAHPEQSLADAQLEKLRRLCHLVDLRPQERLLEIGTGWGSLAMTAARDFGARVTTTTISKNQFDAARALIAARGLAGRVDVLQQDYRDLAGTFDKVLSCEMIEAVGARHLPTFLRQCAARLRPGGILGLQAITIADQHYDAALRAVDYIKRHVFPGSFIPSVTAIVDAATRHTDLRLVGLVEFGGHYAETLRRWRAAMWANRATFAARGGDGLLRAWDYYFAYCEAGFRERHIGVCQMRFERAGGVTR